MSGSTEIDDPPEAIQVHPTHPLGAANSAGQLAVQQPDLPLHPHSRWFSLLWLLVIGVQLDFLVLSTLPSLNVYHPTLAFDRWLFGGVIPTDWLQQQLAYAGAPPLWLYPLVLVYFSHFLVWPIASIYMWVRNRPQFIAFMRCFLPLTFLGYTTYLILPVAPPWLAGRWGKMPEVHRKVVELLDYHHLERIVAVFPSEEITAATVGAVPSLHAAYPMLFMLLLFRRRRIWLGTLCGVYALAMAYTLVYAGEHYVGDILIGWAYALIIVIALDRPWRPFHGLLSSLPRLRKHHQYPSIRRP